MPGHIVIIGAPRSGTNMLRDALTCLPGVGTWPCDEINYIWRHGNTRFPSDEFSADMARPEIQRYIRAKFRRLAIRQELQIVVEKTCANSLRVEFVNRVLPDARYVFIRRNGIDAIASAKKRWTASLDVPYLVRKARFVPISDLPYYATRYLWSRCHRLVSRERRVAYWGPTFNGLDQLRKTCSTTELCALQWKRCIESSANAFATMPSDKFMEVEYERFVRNPAHELQRVADYIGVSAEFSLARAATENVIDSSVGRGRREIGKESVDRIRPLIQDTLERFGYV